MMGSRDPQVREDGFHFLWHQASLHVDALVDAFKTEVDHGLKCWLLELLGLARDPRLTDLFISLLDDADERFRFWAERGLRDLDTKEARTALFAAGKRR
jgi:hypothetical protein